MRELSPRDTMLAPVYAGIVVRARIEELGLTVSGVADRLAMSRASLNNLLDGRAALTPTTALKIERVLGTSSKLLLNIDSTYQLHEAERARREDEADLVEWARRFPVEWMKEVAAPLLDLPATVDWKSDPVGAVLTFFGVDNKRAFEVAAPGVLPRVSHHADRDPLAIRAWLRTGESRARDARLPTYSRKEFAAAVRGLPALTTYSEDPAACFEAMQDAFAGCGVHMSLIPEPPGCKLNGACFWVSPRRPVIVVTGRLKRCDVLWFTVAHEAMHVLHHAKSENYISLESGRPTDDDGVPQALRPEEADADYRAAQLLIDEELNDELTMGRPTAARISELASRHKVHPEVLVGRLLHLGIAKYNWSWVNRLRRDFDPAVLQHVTPGR